jgi:hypothetical protein
MEFKCFELDTGIIILARDKSRHNRLRWFSQSCKSKLSELVTFENMMKYRRLAGTLGFLDISLEF